MPSQNTSRNISDALRRPRGSMTAETRDGMDDLEITKRCAVAMGLKNNVSADGHCVMVSYHISQWTEYDPLHDDTQAMAMVKKMDISVGRGPGYFVVEHWYDLPGA